MATQLLTFSSSENIDLTFVGGVSGPLIVSERTSILNLALVLQDVLVPVGFDSLQNSTDVTVTAAGVITFNTDGVFLVDLLGFGGTAAAFAAPTLLMGNMNYNGTDQKAIQLGLFGSEDFRILGGTYPFRNIIKATGGDTMFFNVWIDSGFAGNNLIFTERTIAAQSPDIAPAFRLEVSKFYNTF